MKTFNELQQAAPQVGDMACKIDKDGNLFVVLVTNKDYQGIPTTQVKVIRDDNAPETVGRAYWEATNSIRMSHSPTSELAKWENLK